MQMVERPWGVTAHGKARVTAEPDLVRARFRVTRTEQEPSAAFAATGAAVRAVRQALRAHGVEDAAVRQSRLDLRSPWDYGAERTFLGYECQAFFAIESGDLEDAQPLLVDLVAAGANELDGVDFDVRDRTGLHAEARRQAVAAARSKAELYTEAAGVRLGAVLHIQDVDPDVVGQNLSMASGAGVGPGTGDLAPGQVTVFASVLLGFAIGYG
jgi:uncharacterized protein YggE